MVFYIAGRTTRKVLPCFSSLSTSILAWWASTIVLHWYSPIPRPFFLVHLKGLKGCTHWAPGTGLDILKLDMMNRIIRIILNSLYYRTHYQKIFPRAATEIMTTFLSFSPKANWIPWLSFLRSVGPTGRSPESQELTILKSCLPRGMQRSSTGVNPVW